MVSHELSGDTEYLQRKLPGWRYDYYAGSCTALALSKGIENSLLTIPWFEAQRAQHLHRRNQERQRLP